MAALDGAAVTQGSDLVRVALWFVAGCISLTFSMRSARIWTSIALGFVLIFLSEAYLLEPLTASPRLTALHSVVGTLAALLITHGFQEYYVFSRTFEAGGSKQWVYLSTLGVVLASALFLLVNPAPSAAVLRNIRMIENTCWVFLALINIDMIRKIYLQVREAPVANGFVAFAVAFALIFLWRGSALYLQVYGWDEGLPQAQTLLGSAAESVSYSGRVAISRSFQWVTGILSSVAVGGSFAYVYRLMR